MLYDKRWDTTAPALADSTAQTLLAAADYIEQHGWCRLKRKNGLGQVCLVGAIDSVGDTPFVSGIIQNRSDMTPFYRLADFLQLDIALWNDNVCRDQEHAVWALRAAAEYLFESHGEETTHAV